MACIFDLKGFWLGKDKNKTPSPRLINWPFMYTVLKWKPKSAIRNIIHLLTIMSSISLLFPETPNCCHAMDRHRYEQTTCTEWILINKHEVTKIIPHFAYT